MTDMQTALKYLNTGVSVIAVRDGDTVHAFTAAWVMPVSFNPPLIAISINPSHQSYAIFKRGGLCSVNILEQSEMALADHYGQSGLANKMSMGTWIEQASAAPILKQSLATFNCQWRNEMQAGDHQLVVCELRSATVQHQGIAMLYADTENMDGSAEIVESGTVKS